MKKTTALIALMLAVLTVAGCSNTLNGAGEDIEHAGRTIQNTF